MNQWLGIAGWKLFPVFYNLLVQRKKTPNIVVNHKPKEVYKPKEIYKQKDIIFKPKDILKPKDIIFKPKDICKPKWID